MGGRNATAMSLAACLVAVGLAGCAQMRGWCGMERGPRVTQRGLTAYWSFDEGSGDIARDHSSNKEKLNGKIVGATYVQRGDGCALAFNGKSSWVNCSASERLNPTGAMTIEAWIKPDGAPKSGLRGVLGKTLEGYAIYQNPSNQFRFHVGSSDNLARTKPAHGEWVHVVGTFDGKKVSIYLNGELAAETQSACAAAPVIKTAFYVGYVGEGPGGDDWGFFQGQLDEVRFYRRALTAEEVRGNFEAAKAGFPGVSAAEPPPAN